MSPGFMLPAIFLMISFIVAGDPTESDLSPSPPTAYPQCRDRYGLLDPSLFRRRACVICHYFLFAEFVTELVSNPPWFHFTWRTQVDNESLSIVVPDPRNETSLAEVCRSLAEDDCDRWRQCCLDGDMCCERQMARRKEAVDDRDHCASTWDGYSCWDRTPAATNATEYCPSFIKFAIPTQKSMKFCTENGSWWENQGSEWTDFTPCLDSAGYITGVHICVALNAVSIAMLLPAVAIFALFRDLCRQDRIRLHIHFFVSLILVNIVNIFWYLMVHKEQLLKLGDGPSVIQTNPIWCRFLSLLKIYLTSTNYFWMFAEGYHLHRLISNAFEAPSSMLSLYGIGWLVPSLGSIIYACIRSSIENESCWAKVVGWPEWIIYVPNFVCLIANLLFLCNILRTLLFQLHTHPHEPSSFRRGLKAGFMLIPLFGVQLLTTIYNPNLSAQGNRVFEIITFIVTNSQGIFVSLIFCFFNGEVLAQFRRFLPCVRKRDDWLGGASHTTHVTMAESRRDDAVTMTTANEATSHLSRGCQDEYEAYADVIPMQDIGTKSQSSGTGYQVVPSKAVD